MSLDLPDYPEHYVPADHQEAIQLWNKTPTQYKHGIRVAWIAWRTKQWPVNRMGLSMLAGPSPWSVDLEAVRSVCGLVSLSYPAMIVDAAGAPDQKVRELSDLRASEQSALPTVKELALAMAEASIANLNLALPSHVDAKAAASEYQAARIIARLKENR